MALPKLFTFGTPFDFGNFSDVGRVRQENEDYFGYFSTPNGELWVVCDGMGGHVGGKRASLLAVETISKVVKESVETAPLVILTRAVEEANRAIFDEAEQHPELKGMGTTAAILLANKNSPSDAFIAHVGDSRIYLLRQGKLKQLTSDHSMVAEMVQRGLITAEEAEHHPERNIITRAIGHKPTVEVTTARIALCKRDRLILCSDGITGPVKDEDIILQAIGTSAQHLSERLVQLANERGGEDNSTIQVIDVRIGDNPPSITQEFQLKTPDPRRRWLKITALIAGSVVIAGCLWFAAVKCGLISQGAGQGEVSPSDTISAPEQIKVVSDSMTSAGISTTSDTSAIPDSTTVNKTQ